MAAGVLFAKVCSFLLDREKMLRTEQVTTFVNTAVVGGPKNELQNPPMVVEIG
jgi:hypothetical protein